MPWTGNLLYEVPVVELETLDAMASSPAFLEKKLVNRLDGQDADAQLVDAARALYPDAFAILPLLRAGQPGFIYKEARERLLNAMVRNLTVNAAGIAAPQPQPR